MEFTGTSMNSIKGILLLVLTAFAGMGYAQKAEIDIRESHVTWTGSKLTGEHTGMLTLARGELKVDKKKLTGGLFEVDMNSITCTDITDKKSNTRLVDHLKSDDFFSVRNHATSRLEITKVQGGKNNEYTVTGNLTIKGITRVISFPATVEITDKGVTANARITFDRSKYNIRFGSNSFFDNLGDEMIYDDIELSVHLAAQF